MDHRQPQPKTPKGRVWTMDAITRLSCFRLNINNKEETVFGFHQEMDGEKSFVVVPEKTARKLMGFMLFTLRHIDQLPLNEILTTTTEQEAAQTPIHRALDPLTARSSLPSEELLEQMQSRPETYPKRKRTALRRVSKSLKLLASHTDTTPYKARQDNPDSEPKASRKLKRSARSKR